MKINMDNSIYDNRQFVLAVKKVYFQAKPAITRPYLKRDFFFTDNIMTKTFKVFWRILTF